MSSFYMKYFCHILVYTSTVSSLTNTLNIKNYFCHIFAFFFNRGYGRFPILKVFFHFVGVSFYIYFMDSVSFFFTAIVYYIYSILFSKKENIPKELIDAFKNMDTQKKGIYILFSKHMGSFDFQYVYRSK